MMSETLRPFDNATLAYAMVRVKDLEASLAFYCGALGMVLTHREDYPATRFTPAFVGYPNGGTIVEFTDNWGHDEAYSHGTGSNW